MPDLYREPIEDTPESVKEIKQMTAAKERPVAPEKPSSGVSEQAPVKSFAPISPAPTAAAPSAPSAPASGGSDIDKERQLKILVDLAFSQGIDKAVEAAKATGDAYLIDKLHDTLADELREQLVEKGKLKEV